MLRSLGCQRHVCLTRELRAKLLLQRLILRTRGRQCIVRPLTELVLQTTNERLLAQREIPACQRCKL
ncbi:hypothetical protein [Paraburkholderia sp. J10-1]|uniref:hypothetical protein n=1 Tax=Paraburkholderia sp. J10-1 TaxID=2805430 RepID=UPI002AB6D542|nr:hypothetical protein [Paraburkholderia sp. J10-1]